ncbi:hypothetical protein BH10PSE5_BH10PSE5_12880 [soil metagenome]
MSSDLVRYVAVAACGYILVYSGVTLLSDSFGLAVPMLFALAAVGTLLARLPAGPTFCLGAGVTTAVGLLIPIIAHPKAPGTLFAGSGVAAAAIALLSGVVLIRRARAQAQEPAA